MTLIGYSIACVIPTQTGYSTGWIEPSRNMFQTTSLWSVISGIALDNAVEVTEMVFHWCGKGREASQPLVTYTGHIIGFDSNVRPLIHQMTESLRRGHPHIYKSLVELELPDSRYINLEDEDVSKAIDLFHNQLTAKIERTFGNSVVMEPASVANLASIRFPSRNIQLISVSIKPPLGDETSSSMCENV